MKLFEFLSIINKEKFPFRLEYIEWSGEVEVIVETFAGEEKYYFDENGVTEFTELQETESSEDKSKIRTKIDDLINRPEKAWIDASIDLGIRFISPYKFVGLNGEEFEVTGLLPDFGFRKGVLISSRKSDDAAIFMADLTNDYLITFLNPAHYDKYDKESFINTLSAWGWNGEESKKPNWIKNN